MKKLALASSLSLLGLLAACNGVDTQATAPTGSSVSGVAAFRSGTAEALAADSTVLGSSGIDTNGTFQITLPEGAEPAFVRADSAGHRLLGLVPQGRRHHIVVDSATHAALDSLRKCGRPALALDSTTWDSLRVRHERHFEGDSLKRTELPDSLKALLPGLKDSLEARLPELKDSLKVRLPEIKDSLAVRKDSLRVKFPHLDTATKVDTAL